VTASGSSNSWVNMSRAFLLVSTCLLLSLASGCATITRGDSQKMKFETDPTGATVKVAGGTYTTPAAVELKRKEQYPVEISKAGYRTITFTLKSTWDGATLGNIILPGGSIGAATDRASGADLKFYPLERVKLTPATEGSGPIELVQHRGKLVSKAEYDRIIAEEREEIFRNPTGPVGN
jgi:hypothetical protein